MFTTALLRTQTDARLVALARDGHERAFEAIVERYRRPLQRYCERFQAAERADDALQQTFVNAWTALIDGVAVQELRPWLYRIARNVSLNQIRRADFGELSATLQGGGAVAEDVERRLVLRETLAAVAALPERQRDALLATAVHGESTEALAAQLGIGGGAARQLVHRARESVRVAMTALTPGPLVTWLVQVGAAQGEGARTVVEAALMGGGGTAAAAIVKMSAVAVTAGALAGGVTMKAAQHERRPAPVHAAARDAGAEPASRAPATTPVVFRRSAGAGAGVGVAVGAGGATLRVTAPVRTRATTSAADRATHGESERDRERRSQRELQGNPPPDRQAQSGPRPQGQRPRGPAPADGTRPGGRPQQPLRQGPQQPAAQQQPQQPQRAPQQPPAPRPQQQAPQQPQPAAPRPVPTQQQSPAPGAAPAANPQQQPPTPQQQPPPTPIAP